MKCNRGLLNVYFLKLLTFWIAVILLLKCDILHKVSDFHFFTEGCCNFFLN